MFETGAEALPVERHPSPAPAVDSGCTMTCTLAPAGPEETLLTPAIPASVNSLRCLSPASKQ